MSQFDQWKLNTTLQASLKKLGFLTPTAIQALTIPHLLEERGDLIAQANTGSGKTAAFGLPLLQKINPSDFFPQALILAPTRELALQISDHIDKLKGELPVKTAVIYGGQPVKTQLNQLQKGVHLVVGTPGRTLDLIKQKKLDLSKLTYFVLDEADEMLKMGFIEDIKSIFEATPDDRTTLLFSATMPNTIQQLAKNYLKKYSHLTASFTQQKPVIEQRLLQVPVKNKRAALLHLLTSLPSFYGIIFCRTKRNVDEVVAFLQQKKYKVDALHGDISQARREKAVQRFKKERTGILVATDIAARGIDVENLTHVINFHIPENAETYVHRIGRTGRAGKKGMAITFCTNLHHPVFRHIKQLTGSQLTPYKLPTLEEILAERKASYIEQLSKRIALLPENKAMFQEWAKELLKKHEASDLISIFLQKEFQELSQIKEFSSSDAPKRTRSRRRKKRFAPRAR